MTLRSKSSSRARRVVGVAYVYSPAGWAEIYALAKRHSLERPGTSVRDINIVMAGTRLKF
jgi:predicted transglutaminase-like cysteine proteinase